MDILGIEREVKKLLNDDITGHDWWHTVRVRRLARRIAENEKCCVDMEIIDLAALLHDVADWKFCNDEDQQLKLIEDIMKRHGVSGDKIRKVVEIVKYISFKGAGISDHMESLEGKIVQDADRLDALGAVGIARCFATGCKLGHRIYDPNIKPVLHRSVEAYKSSQSTSINHFFEKLLLLKDRLHTKSAKRIARERHAFMEAFLRRFFAEWNGEDILIE